MSGFLSRRACHSSRWPTPLAHSLASRSSGHCTNTPYPASTRSTPREAACVWSEGSSRRSNGEQLTASHQGIVVLDQWLIVLPLELALQEGFGLYHPVTSPWVACWILVNFEEAIVGRRRIYKKRSNLGQGMMTKQNESPDRTISLLSPCWMMEEGWS